MVFDFMTPLTNDGMSEAVKTHESQLGIYIKEGDDKETDLCFNMCYPLIMLSMLNLHSYSPKINIYYWLVF